MSETDPTIEQLRAEISERQAVLTAKLEAHAQSRRAERLAKNERIRKLFTPELIDALYPEHAKARYSGNECDDTNLEGSYRRVSDGKEYGCCRCDLLRFVCQNSDDMAKIEVDVEVCFG